MNETLDLLRNKRSLLLQEMQSIDQMRRGSLSKQFFKPKPGQTEQRGPYFVLQGYFHGKKFNQRIPAAQVPQVRAQVDNYRHFQTLAEDYVTLSDEIARIESQDSGSKKNSSRKNSPASVSRKPRPS